MTKRPGYPKLLSGIWRGLVGPVQVALLKGVLKASEKEEKERTKSKTCGTHPHIHSVESCRPQCPISGRREAMYCRKSDGRLRESIADGNKTRQRYAVLHLIETGREIGGGGGGGGGGHEDTKSRRSTSCRNQN